jgi:hypothetical protein
MHRALHSHVCAIFAAAHDGSGYAADTMTPGRPRLTRDSASDELWPAAALRLAYRQV